MAWRAETRRGRQGLGANGTRRSGWDNSWPLVAFSAAAVYLNGMEVFRDPNLSEFAGFNTLLTETAKLAFPVFDAGATEIWK